MTQSFLFLTGTARPIFTLVFGTMIALSTGCSDKRPERVKIAGQVLLDGRPLKQGTVQVYPATGRPAYGKLDAEGRFVLGTFALDDGCPVGTHQVAIVAKEMLGPTKVRWLVPKHYTQRETSGLTITAAEPTDNYKIELRGEGGKPYVPIIETLETE